MENRKKEKRTAPRRHGVHREPLQGGKGAGEQGGAPRSSAPLLLCGLLWIVLGLWVGTSAAQYFLPMQGFGQNKVKYRRFEWWMLRTTYFDIYYNPGYEYLARIAAVAAEEAATKIGKDLHHELTTKVPIILFESPYQFQQNNIIEALLPPGVGGFAESLRFRVVIPFNGDLDEMKRVLTHEITHIFQYSILYGAPLKSLTSRIKPPPTWLMEGMAQYEEGEMGVTDEMVLRDAVLSGDLISLERLDDFGTISRVFLAYKQSESLIRFIAEKYGTYAVARMLREWRVTSNSERLIREVLGMEREQLEREWIAYIRRKFWPQVAERAYAFEFAQPLPKEEKEDFVSVYSPSWSLGGEMIAALGNRRGAFDVVVLDAKEGRILEYVTQGMRVFDYERLRVGEGTVAWSPDGERIAFIAKRADRDRVFVWDVYRARLIRWLDVKDVDTMTSLAWAPDSRRLAISGIWKGKAELFLLDSETGTSELLMDGPHDKIYPAWSPDGKKLAFSGRSGEDYDLFIYEFGSGEITQLAIPGSSESMPCWFPNGEKLLFVSDEGRAGNLFVANLVRGRTHRLTDVVGSVYDPKISSDGRRIAFTAFREGGMRLFVMETPSWKDEGRKLRLVKVGKELPRSEYEEVVEQAKFRKRRYQGDFSLDYAMMQLTLTDRFFNGYAVLGASDLFGDHRLVMMTDYTSFSLQLTDIDFLFMYRYSGWRMPFQVGAINWKQNFYLWTGAEYHLAYDRQFGIALMTSYPIDLYRRIELSYYTMGFTRKATYPKTETLFESNVNLAALSYVHDSVLWGWVGPMRGSRYYLFVGKTIRFNPGDLRFTQLDGDFRKYWAVGKQSAFAFRVKGVGSTGPDGIEHLLGGPSIFGAYGYDMRVWPLRGYGFSAFSGTRVALFNVDYRTMFIRNLSFAWPTTFSINYIRGHLFLDAGLAWNEGDRPTLWVRTEGGNLRLKDLKCGVGFGFEVFLGFLPINIEFAKRTNLARFSKGYKVHVSLGGSF